MCVGGSMVEFVRLKKIVIFVIWRCECRSLARDLLQRLSCASCSRELLVSVVFALLCVLVNEGKH